MLEPENAEKFLDGLSYIAGIRRILVHGPGYLQDNPGECCSDQAWVSRDITISEQPVKMQVLMGDVIVEAIDDKAIDKVARYCEDFFESYPFQILEGSFLKTGPSLYDYINPDPKYSAYDSFFIGLSDTHSQIKPMLIKPSYPEVSSS
ncbi:MAG: hypothetical protein LUQ07_08685 [Methanospirillum sp.]|nr:hypothetical protein [Methanospirillum sp.]